MTYKMKAIGMCYLLTMISLLHAESATSELLGKKGDCQLRIANCLLGEQRSPVCGTDNHTYPNRCQLLRAQCQGLPVAVKHRGKCKEVQPCWVDISLSQRPGKQSHGSKSLFVPVCLPDGTYAPVQCHPESAYCWCVKPDGQSIPDTSVHDRKPDCTKNEKSGPQRRSSPRSLEKKRDCGRRDRTMFNENLVNIFKTEFARFSPTQGSNSGNTDHAVLEWKFSILDLDKDGFLEQEEYRDLRRLVRQVVKPKRCARTFTTLCDLDLDTRISREEWAACLGQDFSLLQGEVRALNGQASSFFPSEDPVDHRDEPEIADCTSDRRGVLDEQKSGDGELYVPECTSDGRYRQVQCYKSTGYCWCVHEDNGKPIPGTSVKDQDPKCDAIPMPLRPMSGCPEPRKQEFLRELMDFLKKKMVAANKTVSESTDTKLADEQVAKWNFGQLDKNTNNVLERKEWKSLRTLVNANRQLRRCGKRLPRYCDINLDRKISLTEWLNCLSTSKNGRATAPPATRRRGHNPLEKYLNGDE